MRRSDVVKTVVVPCLAAMVSAGVESYMNAKKQASRDDALVAAFSSCVQALEDARIVVEHARQKSERSADKSVLESRPLPGAPPGSAVLRMEAVKPASSTQVLDEIARDHGWTR
jgi:hypothetical protein